MERKPEESKISNQSIIMFIINNKAFILMILMIIAAASIAPAFRTSRNLLTVMRQISVAAIVSIGYTTIFSAGLFDFSVGEVMSMCCILYALMSKVIPLPLAIAACVVIGALCGFMNGSLIRIFRLPPFILTLSTALAIKGFTYMMTNGSTVYALPEAAGMIGQGSFFHIPVPFIITVFVLVCMHTLLNKTIYGRHIIASGGNAEAARVSGIRVSVIRITVYMVSGVCTAIGAVVLTGRLASAPPNGGADFGLDAIIAVVIGGTSMAGGKARVVGTVWGVILVAVIGNLLALMGVSPYLQWIIKGTIIITAIILDNQTEIILNKQRERAALAASVPAVAKGA